MDRTRAFFVRHAEPDFSNHNDALRELSPKGMRDRALVTEFLKDKKIDAVLSSPYKRAIDTVKDFADRYGFAVGIVDAFRERKVDAGWIEDYTAFAKRQWEDFSFKLPGGESLQEVQERNIAGLRSVLDAYAGKNVVIGSHGTALSTVIRYYRASFGYEEFRKIKDVMPWIVEFVFDVDQRCVDIREHRLL